MTKRALLASVFAFGAVVAPVTAGDWTGVYIGLHAGGIWGDVETTDVSEVGTTGFWGPVIGESFDMSADGVIGGGQLGYNHEFSGWVFGLEVTGAGMDFDETVLVFTDDQYSVEAEWLVTAAARFGFIVHPSSLIYVKGGYAGGDVQTSNIDTTGPLLGAFTTDETHHGWMAGAGFEHMISSDVSVGVEYNYIDLGNQDHTAVPTTGGTVVNDIDVQQHSVTARLNWHFWSP